MPIHCHEKGQDISPHAHPPTARKSVRREEPIPISKGNVIHSSAKKNRRNHKNIPITLTYAMACVPIFRSEARRSINSPTKKAIQRGGIDNRE